MTCLRICKISFLFLLRIYTKQEKRREKIDILSSGGLSINIAAEASSTVDTSLRLAEYVHQLSTPPYRSEHTNGFHLKSMFWECQASETFESYPLTDAFGGRPIFTLKHEDWEFPRESQFYRHNGVNKLRSLYLLYLEYGDPSEYRFAEGVFGSWDHWLKLSGLKFFADEAKSMREALAVRIDSETIEAMRRIVRTGEGPQVLQAIKWLSERVRPKSKRGRPSKDEVEGELKRQALEQEMLEEDSNRLGITKNG